MTDVFISYARSTAVQAHQVAEALRALGYRVWRDDELPAHRAYAEVIEERLQAAKAIVVIWSAEAVKSEWVQSEADTARTDRKLVQLTVDGSKLPRPFDRIQCADLLGWTGNLEAPGWRKVVASIADLVGRTDIAPAPAPDVDAPLPLPSKPSIAVLPFANLSGDPEQEYFADGLVEEITGTLSRIRSIFVISSGSALSFKGKAAEPVDVARQLGVRYILEGSVRKSGVRVRVAIRLMDAIDGSQIWAERFEDTLEDVFQLQDKVALAVAGRIEPSVRDAEIRRAESRTIGNMGSYDLYLRARASWRTFNKAGLHDTLGLLHRALTAEPNYAAALGFAAWCHGWLANAGWSDDLASDLRQARQLAHRALEVSRDDPEVLAFVADALVMSGADVAVSHRLVEQAVAMNPGLAFGWHMSGIYTMLEGDWDAGLQCIETSMRLDPVAEYRGPQLCWVGIDAFRRGQFEDAAALLAQALQLMPGYVWTHAVSVSCLGHLGRAGEAQRAAARFSAISSLPPSSFVRLFKDSAFRQMFVEGIALAEGKTPTEAR